MCEITVLIIETAMGVKLQSQTEGEVKYLTLLEKLFEVGLYILVRPWLWIVRILICTELGKKATEYIKELHRFTDNVIQERKREILRNVDINSNKTVSEQLQQKC